jgi:hypothetical protein
MIAYIIDQPTSHFSPAAQSAPPQLKMLTFNSSFYPNFVS